jgi:hypothetical protein
MSTSEMKKMWKRNGIVKARNGGNEMKAKENEICGVAINMCHKYWKLAVWNVKANERKYLMKMAWKLAIISSMKTGEMS